MSKEFRELNQPLLTNTYTTVMVEKEHNFNAPHTFKVVKTEEPDVVFAEIHFQEGPIKEVGINGVNNEDLIAMVIARLSSFQNSEYSCKENAMAITKLEEAALWLRARTIGREKRAVEGTSIV